MASNQPPRDVSNPGMTKPDEGIKDRRRDYAQRLKTAVRKAHDRMFSNLRPEEKAPPPKPPAKP